MPDATIRDAAGEDPRPDRRVHRSSPGCPAPAVPRPRSAWRTSGYFVVDNLPPALLPKMAELVSRPGGADAGSRSWSTPAAACSSASSPRRSRSCKPERVDYRIVFLEAVRRATWSTGTKPPGGVIRWRPADRVVEGIRKERLMMETLRGDADLIIDTSAASRRTSCATASATRSPTRRPRTGLQVSVQSRSGSSTGRRGTPTWCSTAGSCRTRTGSRSCGRSRAPTTACATYVQGQRAVPRRSCERLEALLDVIVPGLRRRGQVLPHRRDRLHRRAAPLGGRGRGARGLPSATRACRSSVDHRDLDR